MKRLLLAGYIKGAAPPHNLGTNYQSGSIFFPPRSPSSSLLSAGHFIADVFNKSKSAKTCIESAPFFKAQEIVVVALKTSITTATSGFISGTWSATW